MEKRFGPRALFISGLIGAIAVILIIMGIIVFALGGFNALTDTFKFIEVYEIINNRFIGESDMESVTTDAFRSMVYSIDDNWSYYMTAEEYERYKLFQANSSRIVGITMEMDEEQNAIRIISVMADSAAEKAGAKVGEFIIGLDGETIEGMTISEFREIIAARGTKKFELTLRAEDGSERRVSLAASEVFTSPVEYSMLENHIGYIKIRNFEAKSASDSIAAIESLRAQGAKGLIFDMRHNGGGKVSEVSELLDYILPAGDIFVQVNSAGEERVTVSGASCVEMPICVLVNSYSFSAAEYFAVALWEYDWAETVGSATTGKARSQVTYIISDGSAVHISTGAYLTPNRVDLFAQGGHTPDRELNLSEEDAVLLSTGRLLPDEDEQLILAQSVLTEKLTA